MDGVQGAVALPGLRRAVRSGEAAVTATAVRTRKPRARFHPLTVAAVDPLTEDAVAVTFAIPPELREAYQFAPGQHLTVRRVVDGVDLRRSYSICSTPSLAHAAGMVRIGVREITDGAFSRYAARELKPGDTVDVLPPLGHFTTDLAAERTRHYVAIVAGSGITPVLSLVATALETEPESRFTVVYGNRRAATVMFADELADLKDRYLQRLHLVHVLSREPRACALLSGRIDGDRLRAILASGLLDASSVDEWFLCGPYGMVVEAQSVLADFDVPQRFVHSELFHVEGEPAPPPRITDEPAPAGATVTLILDGRESTVVMSVGERVLDAALRVRSELPYACRGGVCSTCRARLVEGAVTMAHNYALEPGEIAAGYVLTCQSSPLTERLVVDYDA
ncbi:MAG: phenylacetate-CoA oxygenase/reductase subunit PaaK [Sporichthyaceae bacterium]|nr:phenylacetate-CoA oxygenase/reductase subunit PaaK [Sporichthyaceae bacterium]